MILIFDDRDFAGRIEYLCPIKKSQYCRLREGESIFATP